MHVSTGVTHVPRSRGGEQGNSEATGQMSWHTDLFFFFGQVEVAANFEAWNLTKEEMNLLTSQDQVLMDQFPMLNNINGASGLGNLDRWHWLDTPARYDDSFLQRSQQHSNL